LSGLDELAWGLWEGKPNTEEARAAFKEVIREVARAVTTKQNSIGGESPNDVMFRLQQAIHVIESKS
jgi:hypothetical protein